MSVMKFMKISLKLKPTSPNISCSIAPDHARFVTSLHPLYHASSDKGTGPRSEDQYGKVDNPPPLEPAPGDSPLQQFTGLNPGIRGIPGISSGDRSESKGTSEGTSEETSDDDMPEVNAPEKDSID